MKLWRNGTLAAGVGAVATLCAVGFAQVKMASDAHGVVRATELKWTPIIKGCDLTSVSGDMNADGTPFVVRVRCAAGTRIPPHWHPTKEDVTVLKGAFQFGMGEKFDATGLQTMNPGDFGSIPKEARHFAFSKTASIVQIHGLGPFKTTWVNPAEVIPPDAPKKPQ